MRCKLTSCSGVTCIPWVHHSFHVMDITDFGHTSQHMFNPDFSRSVSTRTSERDLLDCGATAHAFRSRLTELVGRCPELRGLRVQARMGEVDRPTTGVRGFSGSGYAGGAAH
jgi:hypothetical protein